MCVSVGVVLLEEVLNFFSDSDRHGNDHEMSENSFMCWVLGAP